MVCVRLRVVPSVCLCVCIRQVNIIVTRTEIRGKALGGGRYVVPGIFCCLVLVIWSLGVAESLPPTGRVVFQRKDTAPESMLALLRQAKPNRLASDRMGLNSI